MSSYTFSQTFTITHAKYLASKVATDLKRMQRLYNSPSDVQIQAFETELAEYLKKGYLAEITYGFKKDDKWIEPSLIYTSKDLAGMSYSDDDPGKVRPGANISGASFYTYLVYSQNWHNASQEEKDSFEKTLPFSRTGADKPAYNGYLSNDKSYSAGGTALDRSYLKVTNGKQTYF